MVEIFLPVEALRRVEIVDTPGLNSIRPEHERVARDFLRDADAIVWVFAAGQAAKATEREALTLAHAAGKRVVGVLNKIDRADAGRGERLVRHVEGTLGDLVDPVVPFSATRAMAAQKEGRTDSGLEALTAVLERRFLAGARAQARHRDGRAVAFRGGGPDAAAPAPVAPDVDGAGDARWGRCAAAAERARRRANRACPRASTRGTAGRRWRSASSSSRAPGCSESTARRPPTRSSWPSCSRTPWPGPPTAPGPRCGRPCSRPPTTRRTPPTAKVRARLAAPSRPRSIASRPMRAG